MADYHGGEPCDDTAKKAPAKSQPAVHLSHSECEVATYATLCLYVMVSGA